MKKIFLSIIAATMILTMPACSSETPIDSETGSQSTIEGTSNIDSEEAPDIKYADMIPNPEEIFKNGEISIVDKDGGSAYIFQVRGFEDAEYESYISMCKEMGFVDISYETENDGGKMFGAYTEDGQYWVEVLLGNDNGILAVTCKESTKNKKIKDYIRKDILKGYPFFFFFFFFFFLYTHSHNIQVLL